MCGEPEDAARRLVLQLLSDRRAKIETRLRAAQYVLDHTHGRAKESVEVENTRPVVVFTPQPIVEWQQEMRKQAGIPDAPHASAKSAQGRNGEVTP